jgi:hypothetical protein
VAEEQPEDNNNFLERTAGKKQCRMKRRGRRNYRLKSSGRGPPPNVQYFLLYIEEEKHIMTDTFLSYGLHMY